MTRFELVQMSYSGSYEVLLDGKDIASTLDKVEIVVEGGELPLVTLHVKATELTIRSDETLVVTDLPDPAMRPTVEQRIRNRIAAARAQANRNPELNWSRIYAFALADIGKLVGLTADGDWDTDPNPPPLGVRETADKVLHEEFDSDDRSARGDGGWSTRIVSEPFDDPDSDDEAEQ